MKLDIDAAYCEIYQVLDDLRISHSLPVGALGKLFFAVDVLRAARAPADAILTAEKISVAMLRWERSRYLAGRIGDEDFRDQLVKLTADWLEVRLPRPAMLANLAPSRNEVRA